MNNWPALLPCRPAVKILYSDNTPNLLSLSRHVRVMSCHVPCQHVDHVSTQPGPVCNTLCLFGMLTRHLTGLEQIINFRTQSSEFNHTVLNSSQQKFMSCQSCV